MVLNLIYILIFPGFLFLSVSGMAAEFMDRKLYARFQNRIGPPWFQPFADFVKLVSKENIVPDAADKVLFKALPLVAIASVVTAMLYIPVWGTGAAMSFSGDVIVVLYLLSLPTLTFFLAGWSSGSLFSTIGAVRALTQFFAYEVPLFISVLSPAVLADSWSLSDISAFYGSHPWYWAFNIIGFCASIIVLLGKLEKVPFDIPEAETEIVGGSFTEYGGKRLAFFRLAVDMEAVVCAALISAVFLPFGLGAGPILVFIFFLIKAAFVISLLALLRTVFARLRIDQMVDFCWKYIAPISFLQLLIDIILKGAVTK